VHISSELGDKAQHLFVISSASHCVDYCVIVDIFFMAILYRFLLIVAIFNFVSYNVDTFKLEFDMKKILIFLTAITTIYAATPEQVDRYLLISGSESQLLQVEQMVEGLSRMFNNGKPMMNDTQMISIRFKEYLQRNLSEDEMQEVMDNYKHEVLRKLVGAQVLMGEAETAQSFALFNKNIKTDPLPSNRTSTIKEIVKKAYNEKLLGEFFDKIFTRITVGLGKIIGKSMPKDEMEKAKKDFIKKMRDNNYKSLLFMTRDFTIDELNELNDIAGSSSSNHETHAVFNGVIFAMEEVLDNMEKKFETMAKERKKYQENRTSTKKPVNTESGIKKSDGAIAN
jgi:hypothetical protein